VVDYGTIRLATLSATDVNQLGTKDVSLSISCPSATKAAWTITAGDNCRGMNSKFSSRFKGRFMEQDDRLLNAMFEMCNHKNPL
ncbi:DUF1120 domain-containing protein, partial [Salmonella enterica subsp. enterica serovar Kentucky]|nr:DUF1120 domain-containing protein [Salmonella enterica subsp. enterica serovar Kentucky]